MCRTGTQQAAWPLGQNHRPDLQTAAFVTAQVSLPGPVSEPLCLSLS